MKTLILALITFLGTQAFAQQQVTCVYQANTSRGTKNIILAFHQDFRGLAAGGQIKVEQPDGRVDSIRIPAQNMQMTAAPMYDAELAVNVHVRSFEVDMVLNYVGNELSHDVANWFGIRGRVTERELMDGYDQLSRSNALYHRNAMPVAQFSGSVRDPYDGRLLKFASTQFQCSSSVLNR